VATFPNVRIDVEIDATFAKWNGRAAVNMVVRVTGVRAFGCWCLVVGGLGWLRSREGEEGGLLVGGGCPNGAKSRRISGCTNRPQKCANRPGALEVD